jgi:CRISPR/Cas system-associated exonuclease Cas4 (RecB family)
MSYPVIKASEIAEYVYCNRAWWLRVEVGYTPLSSDSLARGTAYHGRHGQKVAKAESARRLALAFLFLAVSVFVFWLIRTT